MIMRDHQVILLDIMMWLVLCKTLKGFVVVNGTQVNKTVMLKLTSFHAIYNIEGETCSLIKCMSQ